MGERYTLEQFEEYRKEQDEKAAREREVHRERTEKEAARRAWVREGGGVEDFEKSWPQWRDETRRKRVMEAVSRARAAQRASGVSKI